MERQENVGPVQKTFQVIGLLTLVVTGVTANIQLVGNGYEGVLVAIGPDVEEDPALLTTLESILTHGSAALFTATKNQVYFKEFIVLLPENWQRMEQYDNVLEPGDVDIIIDVPNESIGDTPYVAQYTQCGVGGIFMHLTPTYILNDTVRGRYGHPGILITHEWAHLRYGVFDEYPTTPYEKFYRIGDTWYPTKCSFEVTGQLLNYETSQGCQIDPLTNAPEERCLFFADEQGNPAVSSIMFANYLPNITEFCDNAFTAPDHLKHNIFANNRQNRFCSYQSAWEVMRGHQDFISLSNQAALPNDTDTQPRFRYIQAQPHRRLLVLDTSGSMRGSRLEVLIQATSSFILSIVESGSFLGIVHFANTAAILSPLTQINSDDDREALVDALPSYADDSTSIGAGLLLALEELNKTGSYSGGSIILITDGRENTYPYIADVTPAILRAGVVVHSMSYGQQADLKIANLSQITGGIAVFYSGQEDSTALLDGFANAVTTGNSLAVNKNISIPILTEANTVTPDSPLNGTFYIDSTIGNDTTLTFSYTESIRVDIESPHGPYNATNVKQFSNPPSPTIVLRIVLENDSPRGEWFYRVSTNSSRVSVLTNVQSKPRRDGQGVIQIESWLSQKETIDFTNTSTLGVYARVVRGKTPVVNASVIATVETPCGFTFDLLLLDNGKGTDIIVGDGIYSAIVIATDFCDDGRYNVKIKVVGHKEYTKVVTAGTGSAGKAARLPSLGIDNFNTRTEPLEDFQRVATAGEFRITHYYRSETDAIPPGRIVDFQAQTYVAEDRAVTLDWTAVGGDMDRGQASAYIIYKSLDVGDIISNNLSSASQVPEQHVRQGNLSSPSAAGEREEFVVFLEELDANDTETVYLSISAVDEAGNVGQASNLVTVSDARNVAFVGRSIENSDSDNKFMIGVVAGSVTVAAIIIIIAVVVLVVRNKSSAKSTSAKGMAA